MKQKRFGPKAVVIVYLILLYLPLYWLCATALKDRIDIVRATPKVLFKPTLANFSWVFSFSQVTSSIATSLIVAVSSVLFALAVGSLAAYAIARFRFRARTGLRDWTLTVRMLPPVAVVLPMYLIWTRLGLHDTYFSLIVTYLAVSLPLVIWLEIGFIKQIPIEMEESAKIDGCGPFAVFLRITLPNAVPGIIVASILSFIFVWNDLFFAFVLTSFRTTFPVVINSMATTGLEVRWGEMAAMGVLSIIPAVAFGLFARNLLIRGFQGLASEKY